MFAKTAALGGAVTVNFSALAFYSKNCEHYKELWRILGRDWTDLPVEAMWAARTIPGPDHGFLKIALTAEQRAALLPVLKHMGFFRALDIKPGVIDELKLSGAKFHSMVTRIKLIKSKLDLRYESGPQKGQPKYVVRRIKCQFGHRPRTDKQDGTVTEINSRLSANVLAHPWVQQQLGKTGDGAYEGPWATEFDLGTLGWLMAYDGNIEMGEDEPSNDTEVLAGTVLRTVASRTLTLPDGTMVQILNCPAVERRHDPARPTTTSSTRYWLDLYPPKPGSRLVVVSGPTHGYRVAGSFERSVHAHPIGRTCTVNAISSSTAQPEAFIDNALGEAVWLLVKATAEMLSYLPGGLADAIGTLTTMYDSFLGQMEVLGE